MNENNLLLTDNYDEKYEMLVQTLKYIFGIDISNIVLNDIEENNCANTKKMFIKLSTYLNNNKINITLKIIIEKYNRINEDIIYLQVYINSKLGRNIKVKPLKMYRFCNNQYIGLENYIICELNVDYFNERINTNIEPIALNYFINI